MILAVAIGLLAVAGAFDAVAHDASLAWVACVVLAVVAVPWTRGHR